MVVLAMTADAFIVLLSFLIAASDRHLDMTYAQIVTTHFRLLSFSLAVFLFYFTSLGLYRTVSYSSFQRQAFKAGKGYVYSVATILSTLFILQNPYYSRRFLLLFFVLFPIFYVPVWTAIRTWVRMMQRKGFGRWNAVAIGAEPLLNKVLKRIDEHPELGYDLVNVITTKNGTNGHHPLHVERVTVEKIVNEKPISLLVFSTSDLNGSFEELEGLCRKNRIAMRVVSPESDYLFSKARLHDIAGIPLYTPERYRIDSLKRITKRAFDLIGATIGLIILSPLFLVVAVATKLESKGPVFFRQRRSLDDRSPTFEFIKFRSMYQTADEKKESLLAQNEASGALFKIKNDPRLTKVGRIIRKYSIDELPQLFNVVKGEMSLVGPRPLPVKDFQRIREEDHMGGYFRQRASVKPGMTGLWQVSGRSDLGFREMVLLDLYYVENQTILFDFEILAQTVPVVLFGKGAY